MNRYGFNVQHFLRTYRRIFAYTKAYKRNYILGVFLAVLIAFLAPIRPFLIKYTIDHYVSPAAGARDIIIPSLISGLMIIFIIQLALLLTDAFFRFYFTFLISKVSLSMVANLREQVYEKILRLRQTAFDTTPIGSFTTRTVNDVEAMNQIFSEGFVPMFADILSIVIVIIGMFWIDWQLALLSIATIPMVALSSYYFDRYVKKSFQKVRSAVSKMNAFTQEHLSNRDIIRIFRAEKKELEAFKAINEMHKKANISAIFAYSVFYPVIEIIAAIGLVLLLLFSLHFQVDAAKVVFYFLSLSQIFRPLRFIADRFNTIQMGIIAAKRIFRVLDSKEIVDTQHSTLMHRLKGSIRFDKVSFYYIPEQPVLREISFDIPPLTKTALVGYTGQGKSSIVSLINRLYQHQEGNIFLDDIPVERYELTNLRRQITLIPQNVFLFSGTLYKNITLDNPNIDAREVKEACRLLNIHDTIMQLPNGYQHIVGERGCNLSSGQRQLICMARALVTNTRILIMDEATSYIDTQSEILVGKAIEVLAKKCTILIIAHRLSTVIKADNILFIEGGRVAESGTHEMLIKKKGKYFNLYQKQPFL